MDLLDRLLGHDLWTTQQLLQHCGELSDGQWDQAFALDSRSLRQCFMHLIDNLETWTDLLYERPPRPAPSWGTQPPGPAMLLTAFTAAHQEFAGLAQDIARAGRWDDAFMDVLDRPPRPKRFGGAIGHVLTHNMHHRAQIMFMMEQLGLRDHIEGDLLTWENQVYWPAQAKAKP